MNFYERDGNFLVILPSLPQWFIVDELGKNIAVDIGNQLDIKEIQEKYVEFPPEEIVLIYSQLLEIMSGEILNYDQARIEKALTSRTTVSMVCLTRRCNLECPHCYVDALGLRGDELSIGEHRQIAADLRRSVATDMSTIYKVNLTGGEPFVCEDILEIIDAYHEQGFGLTMSTNGLLISHAHIPFLISRGVSLSISLDGSSAQTHDAIRGAGTFAVTTGIIRELTTAGVKVGINCLMHKGNFHEFEKMIELVHELGCSGFNPINLVQLGRACASSLDRVSETELFRRIAAHIRSNPNHAYLFPFSSLFGSLGAALLAGIACVNCGVGSRPCAYISELGDVYPCPNTQRKEFLLGNVRTNSISECLDIDHSVYASLRGIDIGTLNEHCARCDVRYFCGGDCRGETYNVTGNMDAPYIACNDRHDSLIELMWIVAEMPEVFEGRSGEYIAHARAI